MQNKNTLGDLNDILFQQLNRLNNENIKGEKLQEEISRGKAIGDIAKNIIQNGNLVLQGQKFIDEKWDANKKLPKMLEGEGWQNCTPTQKKKSII